MATTDELEREPGSPAGVPPSANTGGRAWGDAAWLAAVGLGAFTLLLSPFVVRGWRFPLGPDTPVYLWWTRIAGAEGLSAVGARPGEPALALITQGTLHLRVVAVAAGLEIALSVALALAAAALVHERFARGSKSDVARAKFDRPEWILAGLFAGAFAIHLAGGYLSNLVFAAGFIAAGALLAHGTRRGAVSAAAVLGGTGLAHPEFFALGLVILAVAAIPSLVRDRRRGPMLDQEFGRVGLAIVGGALLVGAGLTAMLGGPRPLDVDTSKDAILRRLGLVDELRHDYVSRFFYRWTRYVPYVQVPLAIGGVRPATGFAGRFLRSWAVISLTGIALGLATRWFPPDRFVTFAFAVPMLAALGLVRLWSALERRRLVATIVCIVLGAVVVGGPAYAWLNQKPWIAQDEVAAASDAGRLIEASPAGARFVFLVDSGSQDVTFTAARAGNIIRAAAPPVRIPDIAVRFGTPAQARDDFALSSTNIDLRALRRAYQDAGPSGTTYVVLAPFSTIFAAAAQRQGIPEVAPGVFSTGASRLGPVVAASGPEPVSAVGLAVAAAAILILLAVVGYGWSRIVFGAGGRATVGAVGTAPGIGLGVLVLVGVLLGRVGLPLSGVAGPTAVAILAGGAGYLAAFVLERRSGAKTPSKVQREDGE